MARTAVLGLPRIGPDRELKLALEAYWAGRAGADELLDTARALRRAGWERARDAGIDVIPSGDFSLYDHVLDTAWAVRAIPERFGGGLDTAPAGDAAAGRSGGGLDTDRADGAAAGRSGGGLDTDRADGAATGRSGSDLDTAPAGGAAAERFRDGEQAPVATAGRAGGRGLEAYFAMARGTAEARPLEMTKWFDTNYHHLVPELSPDQEFRLDAGHWLEPLREAAALGIETRPVVLGPATFLLLSKGVERPLDALPALVPVYERLLRELVAAGAREVQLDEPCLALDRTPDELDAILGAIEALAGEAELCVATYFASLGDALERVLALPVAEVHLDLVRAPEQLEPALRAAPRRLSLGVVDGRNVWVTDPDRALAQVAAAVAALGEERVTIAPSCSLLHVPYEAARETALEPEARARLAFAVEKLGELRAIADRRPWTRPPAPAGDPAVRERVAALTPADYERTAPAAERREAQRARMPLPDLPATTIGSFPQTAEIRAARRELREGRLDRAAYERFMDAKIAEAIAAQERLGLDLLVHGEPERADMVEYFGEQLEGFAFSQHGWVQSYGSRCVKPPILFGDVSRPAPMTVRWWQAAQALTDKPVKGMLTGPITILQWSFVRDDQPRRDTCLQIALAIRDEVADLERAGAFAIQVDEAAFREGLPLRRADQAEYLGWAVDAFRLAVAAVRDDTQVHTHMCYSEFGGFGEHIARLDADVLSIEASRSGMEVPDYPNDIGPGVYDIHSPRVPSQDEIERLLEQAEARVGRERLWVNPDCGLKTRRWEEVLPALEHMMGAVRSVRARA